MPIEVICRIEKVGQITTKLGRVVIVVSLVAKDGMSLRHSPLAVSKMIWEISVGVMMNGSSNLWESVQVPETETKVITIMR